MDPLTNSVFSKDFQNFVLQDPNVRFVNKTPPPFKPKLDKINKSKKDKKDKEKQKDKEQQK